MQGGGAIYSYQSTLTLTSCTISDTSLTSAGAYVSFQSSSVNVLNAAPRILYETETETETEATDGKLKINCASVPSMTNNES